MSTTPERSDPLDRALDLVVFAPLGLALSARQLLPELAEKGRQQVEGQLTMARVVGEFAIREGRSQAERILRRWQEQAETALRDLGLAGAGEAVAEHPQEPARPVPSSNGSANGSAQPAPTSSPSAAVAARHPAPPLAIPGYDNLSASQVVARLPGLSRSELEAVRAYEQASRARKTVLARIAQLQLAS